MDITFIIPTHGRPDTLSQAVQSVLDQTVPAKIVVVDDAGEPAAAVPDGVRLVRRDVNGGAAAARNTGLAVADTEWVTFLDDDDRLLPRWVERVGQTVDAHPDWDIVATDMAVDGGGMLVGRPFPSSRQLEEIMVRSYLPATCAVRRQLVAEVGGFDEGLRSREDLELWMRLLHRRARAGKVDEVLAVVRPGGKSENEELTARSRVQVLRQALSWDLDAGERRAAESTLRVYEDRLAMVEARLALASGRPARRLLWKAARGRTIGRVGKVKALAAWVSPPLGRRFVA